MFLTTSICCAIPVALILHYLLVGQKKIIVGPETFFLILATGSFVATLLAASEAGNFSHPYVNFIGAGLIFFILGTATSSFLLNFRHRKALKAFISKPWINDLAGLQLLVLLIVGITAVSVTLAYFYLLGFFVPQEALRALLANGRDGMSVVYNDLRRESSATGTYLGSGYVFQFKNCLLPLITIILFYRTKVQPRLSNYILFGLFLVPTALALVGTGSRFALAFFAVAFITVGLSGYMVPYRLTYLQTLSIFMTILLLLSALTLMMGTRGQDKIVDHPLLWAPLQVLDRAFASPARERFEIFELFLRHQTPQWGQGTLKELEILLPGRQYYSLSNQLHEILYGSATGNVGLDIWGNLWYESQWYGLVAIFLYGFLCNAFYVAILRGPKRFMRVIILTYAGLILGLATDLQVLILRGFVTCLIFVSIIHLARYLENVLVASRTRLKSNGTLSRA